MKNALTLFAVILLGIPTKVGSSSEVNKSISYPVLSKDRSETSSSTEKGEEGKSQQKEKQKNEDHAKTRNVLVVQKIHDFVREEIEKQTKDLLKFQTQKSTLTEQRNALESQGLHLPPTNDYKKIVKREFQTEQKIVACTAVIEECNALLKDNDLNVYKIQRKKKRVLKSTSKEDKCRLVSALYDLVIHYKGLQQQIESINSYVPLQGNEEKEGASGDAKETLHQKQKNYINSILIKARQHLKNALLEYYEEEKKWIDQEIKILLNHFERENKALCSFINFLISSAQEGKKDEINKESSDQEVVRYFIQSVFSEKKDWGLYIQKLTTIKRQLEADKTSSTLIEQYKEYLPHLHELEKSAHKKKLQNISLLTSVIGKIKSQFILEEQAQAALSLFRKRASALPQLKEKAEAFDADNPEKNTSEQEEWLMNEASSVNRSFVDVSMRSLSLTVNSVVHEIAAQPEVKKLREQFWQSLQAVARATSRKFGMIVTTMKHAVHHFMPGLGNLIEG